MLDESTTGQTLRRLRELSGMNERTAARRLGVRRAELRDWEEHRAAPDAAQLTRAIDVYGQDAETTLAIRRPLTEPDRPGVLVVGDEEIVIADHVRTAATSHQANEAVLASYLAAVRRQRSLAADAPVQLRSADISSLSIELDLTDDHLQDLLADLLQLTPAGAQYTTRALLVVGVVAVAADALGVNHPACTTPVAISATSPPTSSARVVYWAPAGVRPRRSASRSWRWSSVRSSSIDNELMSAERSWTGASALRLRWRRTAARYDESTASFASCEVAAVRT